MKLKITIFASAICFTAYSCQSDKVRKAAEVKTNEFFYTLKKEDEKKLSQLYPGFENFKEYFKSDSGKIISTTETAGVITVTVDNHFTNKFGKLNQEAISLYYKPDSLDVPFCMTLRVFPVSVRTMISFLPRKPAASTVRKIPRINKS